MNEESREHIFLRIILLPISFSFCCTMSSVEWTKDSSLFLLQVCSLQILLLWDFKLVKTLERDFFPFFRFLMNTHPRKRATRNEHYYFPIPAFPLILDSQGEPTGLCWSILHMFRLALRKQWLFSSWYFFNRTAAFLIFWNNL